MISKQRRLRIIEKSASGVLEGDIPEDEFQADVRLACGGNAVRCLVYRKATFLLLVNDVATPQKTWSLVGQLDS